MIKEKEFKYCARDETIVVDICELRAERRAIIIRKSLSWENNEKISHKPSDDLPCQREQQWKHSAENAVIIVINSGILEQHEKGGKRLTILFTWKNLFLFFSFFLPARIDSLEKKRKVKAKAIKSMLCFSFAPSSPSSNPKKCSVESRVRTESHGLGIFTGNFFFISFGLSTEVISIVSSWDFLSVGGLDKYWREVLR